MCTATHSEPLIPALDSLGDDLLATSPRQRRLALARPIIGLIAYGLAADARWWWSTPFLVFLIFVAVVTVTHDVVHGSLGLSRRQTDWAVRHGCGALGEWPCLPSNSFAASPRVPRAWRPGGRPRPADSHWGDLVGAFLPAPALVLGIITK